MLSESEKELEILETIHRRADEVHQRDLARIVGLSLGMTNAIIKRLAQKGWITVRKVNNRNIRYAVTPAGIDQITRRSFRYLKRTIRNVVVYKEAIEALVMEVRRRGFESLLFVGRSDLDFVVEYACEKYGLEYLRRDPQAAESVYYLYSEDYIPESEPPHMQRGGDGAAATVAARAQIATSNGGPNGADGAGNTTRNVVASATDPVGPAQPGAENRGFLQDFLVR